MPLILTEQILGDLIRTIQTAAGSTLDDAACLELIAASFGLPDPLALLSAVSDGSAPDTLAEPTVYPPVLEFWHSGLLNSFITDYSCRRQPVVAILSGCNSIIVLSSAPARIFEIHQNGPAIHLDDLGSGPWPSGPSQPIGQFDTPPQAFDHLCQMHGWDWSHSAMDDVS